MKWLMALVVLVVVGCSKPPPPPVLFTEEEIAQLKMGMSREEVLAIVGEPPGYDNEGILMWENPDEICLACSFGHKGTLAGISKVRNGEILKEYEGK